jgi:putative heme-binding domain-containing protein
MGRSACRFSWVFLIALCLHPVAVRAQDAGAMIRLLKSGRLPPERIGAVLKLACERGNDQDLAYIYEQVTKPDALPADLRRQAIEGLATAAQTRKVRPQVPSEGLLALFDDRDPATARAAVRLAAAWQLPSLAPPLAERVLNPKASDDSRRMALEALLAIGGEPAKETIAKLLASDNTRLQSYGVAALAHSDLSTAATRAAALLNEASGGANVDVLLDALLDRQGGSEKLAAALAATSIPADNAKLALRHMYLAGRSDAQLADILSKAAGLHADRPPPTLDELKVLSAEVLAKGDPVRGEAIFRRADLGCMKCHSVSGAGGDVGPDLSPVGATSPVDYVITSILHPDLSIKESFLTRNFITSDGMIHQGIVVDRDDNRVIVKDATGRRVTIPVADIDEESEGRSLMPKGLASFLTQAEFFDLVRFVGELGKPGPYAVRSKPTIQRWRYLKETPAAIAAQVPDEKTLAAQLAGVSADAWSPAYGKVDGTLPLAEFAGANKVLLLSANIDVTEPGPVDIKLDHPAGVTMWIDGEGLAAGSTTNTLARGLHTIYLRVDRTQHGRDELRAIVDKPPGSTVSYTVVGGP